MFWGVLEHFPAIFQWFHLPQLPAHPTVTPLSGGLGPAALCSTACGASQVPLAVRDVDAERGTEAVTFLVSAVPCDDVWDSFPWLGFCSRARPTLQCRAPQQGPGWVGSAVLLALPPSAH